MTATNEKMVEEIRLVIAKHDGCFLPCACNENPHGKSCHGVALEIAALLSPSQEGAVEAVADAIDHARYAHPDHPRERARAFSDADASDREYGLRLARAALAALRSPPLPGWHTMEATTKDESVAVRALASTPPATPVQEET